MNIEEIIDNLTCHYCMVNLKDSQHIIFVHMMVVEADEEFNVSNTRIIAGACLPCYFKYIGFDFQRMVSEDEFSMIATETHLFCGVCQKDFENIHGKVENAKQELSLYIIGLMGTKQEDRRMGAVCEACWGELAGDNFFDYVTPNDNK